LRVAFTRSSEPGVAHHRQEKASEAPLSTVRSMGRLGLTRYHYFAVRQPPAPSNSVCYVQRRDMFYPVELKVPAIG
jgi:hypothetical protein